MFHLNNCRILLIFCFFLIPSMLFAENKETSFEVNLKPIKKECLLSDYGDLMDSEKKCSFRIILRTSELVNAINYCLLDMASKSTCNSVLAQLKEITPYHNLIIENTPNNPLKKKNPITKENLALIEKLLKENVNWFDIILN